MVNKYKKVLTWIALVAAISMLVLFAVNSGKRERMLVDTGETRQSVQGSINSFSQVVSQSTGEQSLLEAARTFSTQPYVSQTWLLDADGNTLFLKGIPLDKTELKLDDRVTLDTRRVIAALPDQSLNQNQEMMIKIASAIQAEGEHGDVFRYAVVPVYDNNQQATVYLAVAYEINPTASASSTDVVYMVSLFALFVSVLVYWLALPLWTWLDARQRGERDWVWALYVLLGNLVALIAYILVRQPTQEKTV